MHHRPFIAAIAMLIALTGCASDDDDDALKFLGSKLITTAGGAPASCTNYYGELSGAERAKLPADRTEPCPAAGAKGACELPASASGALMTQDEVVYYDDQHATLKDGDPCNGDGVWQTPYPAQTGGGSINEGPGY